MESKTNEFIKQLNRHMDISCVKSTDTKADIDEMVAYAKEYRFITVFTLPCYTPYVINELRDEEDIQVGGVVGFPSGCDSTETKICQAKELVNLGCKELDMVMSYSMLQSGSIEYVAHDIKEVVKAAAGIPVKVIIEASVLNDLQLCKACEIAVEAGASFVKSGTGWTSNPTTPEIIRRMKEVVGERALIKAAGGIRTLDTVLKMRELGCERFGVSTASAVSIMKEASVYG
ncbi:deoxyribose-phosphate aldolase [Anaerosporobacter sp.]|uniref:deoxyribose-phosphate aldolase n=1 Tax=Anaerosporobacter sp. TaxID=1872529 RepID=UPI00286F12B2|nr:deoxyribose-phosphate aldolase [Anaerosporobacter sp.]